MEAEHIDRPRQTDIRTIRQKIAIYLSYVLFLALLGNGCNPNTPVAEQSKGGRDGSQKASQSERIIMRILVHEQLKLRFQNWDEFECFKCMDVDKPENGLINIVAPKLPLKSKNIALPDNFKGFRVGCAYRVELSQVPPSGWSSIEPEFLDDRLGLIALWKVIP